MIQLLGSLGFWIGISIAVVSIGIFGMFVLEILDSIHRHRETMAGKRKRLDGEEEGK